MNQKYCEDCLYKLDLSQFDDSKRSKDGKRKICTVCVNAKLAKDQVKYRVKNKVKRVKSEKLRSECREDDKIKEKICIRCEKSKTLNKFTTDKSTVSRHARICKECNYKSREEGTKTPADFERIKKIMAVPVNVKKTQAYWMLRMSGKLKAKELELR